MWSWNDLSPQNKPKYIFYLYWWRYYSMAIWNKYNRNPHRLEWVHTKVLRCPAVSRPRGPSRGLGAPMTSSAPVSVSTQLMSQHMTDHLGSLFPLCHQLGSGSRFVKSGCSVCIYIESRDSLVSTFDSVCCRLDFSEECVAFLTLSQHTCWLRSGWVVAASPRPVSFRISDKLMTPRFSDQSKIF